MIRNKTARALRKWADLIDPRTPPLACDVLTVRIECDATPFFGTLAEVRAKLLKLSGAIDSVNTPAVRLPKQEPDLY